MRLVDSHCHLDRPELAQDLEAVLERAVAAGVVRIVIPAIAPEGFTGLLALAASRPALLTCGLGLHPQALPTLDPADDEATLRRLGELLAASGPVVALGECGLDGPATKLGPWGSMERQLRLLEAQLTLARELELPVLLHVLRAHGEALRLLERLGPLPAGGVLHSYSGSAELVPRYRKLGLSFSFTGPVTFAASVRVHAAARAVPSEALLLETDAPDQPPARHQGERNEPAWLPEILEALANLRGEPVEELAAATTANACSLFGL